MSNQDPRGTAGLAGVLLLAALISTAKASKPHIIFIQADDLGYNDVQYNNDAILTPKMKEMAEAGVILENYYAQPVCSPSRAALLTGLYPFRLGQQGTNALDWDEKHGLPLQRESPPHSRAYKVVQTLPQALKNSGYYTYMVGKWHLGYCHVDLTPTKRGFDEFYGFYLGAQDYYTHKSGGGGFRGNDLRDQFSEAINGNSRNVYDTYLFKNESVKRILNHPTDHPDEPMFLYLSFNAPHSPLEVDQEYKDKYPSTDVNRQTYAGMVTAMDDAIRDVYDALDTAGMLSNAIIVFASDNGGSGVSSNYPLRGKKGSLWEGGTRVASFVYSPLLSQTGYRSKKLMHITDWLPTFVSAAGGTPDASLDGIDQWSVLKDNANPVRTKMVYDIDSYSNLFAVRHNNLKLIYVNTSIDANSKIEDGSWLTDSFNRDQIGYDPCPNSKIRRRQQITKLLFDIDNDEAECTDLSSNPLYQNVITEMENEIASYLQEEIPREDPQKYPTEADPANFNGYFSYGWCELDKNQQIEV